MTRFEITDERVRQFHTDGYIIVDDLLSSDEIELLRKIAKERSEGHRRRVEPSPMVKVAR